MPAAPHSTAQHSTAQHSTAQHSTAQQGTAQDSTAHRIKADDVACSKCSQRKSLWCMGRVAVCRHEYT
jgi:hypothetical protein